MSAYQILDEVRSCGISAPTAVYRALERLTHDGSVRRVESLGAYVACRHRHGAERIILTFCDGCGRVDEIDEKDIAARLTVSASRSGFMVRSAVVELLGKCGRFAGCG